MASAGTRLLRPLAAALTALGLLATAPVWQPAQAASPSGSGFSDIFERHTRAMRPVAAFFAQYPLRLDFLEGDPAHGKQVTLYWQGAKFRQEWNWLGFTEVFASDGHEHWYGSDINLPYSLDNGNGADYTSQLVSNFAYLAPAYGGCVTPAGDVLLNLADSYAVLRFAPPGMSEALLLLDPLDFRLSGALQGNEKTLAASVLYVRTTYEDWADFGACWYPAVTRIVTLSTAGEELRERFFTTQNVTVVGELAEARFTSAGSPPLAQPALSSEPFEIEFSFLSDNVVLKCQGPDGAPLRMELDTGANVGLLRRDVARKLGLQLAGDEQVTGHGGNASVQYGRVEGLKLLGTKHGSSVTLPPFPAAVLGTGDRLDQSLSDGGISGLLGNFLLHNFVVKLDFRRRMLTLYTPAEFDPAKHLGKGCHAIPVQRDSLPYVQITVDDKLTGGAFFNTGAQQFLALNEWALEKAGLKYEVESVGTALTVDGFSAFGIVRPHKVQLGDIIISNPPAHLEMLAPGEAPDPNRIGAFGNDFFQHHIVTFDLFHEMYYIEGSGL